LPPIDGTQCFYTASVGPGHRGGTRFGSGGFRCWTVAPQISGDSGDWLPHDARVGASPKLQKAGRRFLLRLVAENGPEAAAAVLRDLADELEWLAF